jgi:hypothetical protein
LCGVLSLDIRSFHFLEREFHFSMYFILHLLIRPTVEVSESILTSSLCESMNHFMALDYALVDFLTMSLDGGLDVCYSSMLSMTMIDAV